MKHHTLVHHTPDHLMPFVCKFENCTKGFVFKGALEQHMNIHLGIKPHKCKYCDAAFADIGNKRMHERCAHEGHKRR